MFKPVLWCITLGAAWGLAGPLPALAQAPASASPTSTAPSPWAAWLEAAWARHPPAASLGARQDEVRLQRDTAAGLTPGPVALSLSQLQDRWGAALPGAQGRAETEVELSAPLWRPGQRHTQAEAAEAATQALAARAALWRWQLAGELRSAAWALAQTQHARTLAEERLRTAQALQAEVQRRWHAGELPRLDANQASTETLAAQAELQEAQAAEQEAAQRFTLLTGQPAPATLAPEAPAPSPEDEAPAADHPWLAALRAEATLATRRVALAQSRERAAPELALRWLRERGASGEPYAQALGLKLTVPLGAEGSARQESASARAELLQAEAELAQARAELRLQTQQAAQAEQAAAARLGWATQRQQLAQDTLRLTERAYTLGEADLPALLRARAAAREAQAELNRQTTAQAQARSRRLQAQGVLP